MKIFKFSEQLCNRLLHHWAWINSQSEELPWRRPARDDGASGNMVFEDSAVCCHKSTVNEVTTTGSYSAIADSGGLLKKV